tara:strand:- start:105 stop:518 length:414 start_codon:yes stop_codon:yes gene_type:complete
LKKSIKYNKAEVEQEAIKSLHQGRITNALGKFILERASEISRHGFVTNGSKELNQSLIDEAVMRVCTKFLDYYVEGKSAANLIIGMIYSTMTNKIVSLKWRDIYGTKIKGHMIFIEDGVVVKRLVKYIKDDYLSEKL